MQDGIDWWVDKDFGPKNLKSRFESEWAVRVGRQTRADFVPKGFLWQKRRGEDREKMVLSANP